MPYNTLEADEADEFFEADDADETDEAARRTWSRPRVASGQNLFRGRPQTQYVTQAQLETALAKVGAQVRTNSSAINQLSSRVSTTLESVRKESGNRKKDVTALRSNL